MRSTSGSATYNELNDVRDGKTFRLVPDDGTDMPTSRRIYAALAAI